MITTIRLVNSSIMSHNYNFSVCVVRTFKIHSLSNFQVCNIILLTTVTVLCIRRDDNVGNDINGDGRDGGGW